MAARSSAASARTHGRPWFRCDFSELGALPGTMNLRTRTLSALLIVAFASACVSNPARRLTPNDEEITVNDKASTDDTGQDDGTPRPFARGAEALDEEEFYTLIGDTASAEKVHSNRSTGVFKQGLGMTMLITGITALAAGFGVYLLSRPNEDGKAVIPLAEEKRQYPLYATYAGLPLALGGGFLYGGNKDRARGVPMTFDLKHAQASLDRSLYGDQGASPADVKSITFSTSSGDSKLCSGGAALLTPVQARDTKGRLMKLEDHAGWFTWSTTPEVPMGGLAGLSNSVTSPLGSSLALLDQDIRVTAAVQGTGVKHELVLQHDLSCAAALGFSGKWGGRGESGEWGREGQYGTGSRGPQSGGNGQRGGEGGEGAPGAAAAREAR